MQRRIAVIVVSNLMARRRLFDARRDLISELPLEIKDRILEFLPTRDAARTALLSTHWNDVWLKHGRLAFDWHFFESVQKFKDDDEGRAIVSVIDNIVFFRAGPIKKFTLDITFDDPKLLQCDIDRWCLLLSRNGVEELNLRLCNDNHEPGYDLPFCIVWCRTIKLLKLEGLFIDLPANASCIFPSVTSLHLVHVEFENSGNRTSSISIPNLEELYFHYCRETDNFDISSPKLETLSAVSSVDQRWLTPHLKVIKTLWLCGGTFKSMNVSLFPTAINLQVMMLYELIFDRGEEITAAMQLLKKFPNLRELDIVTEEPFGSEDKETSRLLEDSNNCFISPDLKMLNTIKILGFSGSTLEMLFMKMLLSKSPALDKVFIEGSYDLLVNPSKADKIIRDLLRFPRASLKAKIVRCTNGLIYYPWM